MPKTNLPRIEAAEAKAPCALRLRWAHGGESTVDVSGLVDAFRIYEPLRANPALFEAAKVGEYGTHVVWSDQIDIAATTLWRLSQEQSGATYGPQTSAAGANAKPPPSTPAVKALGVSPRRVA